MGSCRNAKFIPDRYQQLTRMSLGSRWTGEIHALAYANHKDVYVAKPHKRALGIEEEVSMNIVDGNASVGRSNRQRSKRTCG